MINVNTARVALADLDYCAKLPVEVNAVGSYRVLKQFIDQTEELINSQKAKTPALLREIENVYE